MTNQEEIQFIAKMLFDKYSAIALDSKTTASIVGKSEIALKWDRAHSTGIPYTKTARLVKYAVTDIAKHLIESRVKVGV